MTTTSDAMDILRVLRDEMLAHPDDKIKRDYAKVAWCALGSIDSEALDLSISVEDILEVTGIEEDDWDEAEARLEKRKE